MKMLIQNITILNLVLILVIMFFVVQGLFPSLNFQIKYALPAAKKSLTQETETETQIPVPSPADYGIISGGNLFHPERKIPVEKKAEQPLPKPDFILYGTLITDSVSLAYIEDLKAPRNTPGRGKRQTALKKGDALSGFIVKEIEPDRIVMSRGEEKIVVSVSDPSRQKDRSDTVTTSTAVKPSLEKTPPSAPVHPPATPQIRKGFAPAPVSRPRGKDAGSR